MNHIVPIFGMEEDGTILSSEFFSQKKSSMQDDELMEILWKNGQVVMQNHNQRPLRKSPPPPPKLRVEDAVLPVPPDKSATSGQVESSKAPEGQLFIHEDEMASWLHYPLDEPLDRDFCADLLYHPPPGTSQVVADRRPEIKPAAASSRPPVSPARRTDADNSNLLNLGLFSRTKGKDESRPLVSDKTGRESTVVDSSVTPSVGPGSPRVRVSAGGGATTGSGGNFWSEGTCGRSPETEMGTCDTMMTSSSGGSGASGNPPPKPSAGEDRKRKAREGDEFEGLCEDAEFEAVEEKKILHRSASTRRTRSAEVHNLSERRRRDRINEKMKALQELIPRCNKTDKASMLDEAIEYLKSLQLQVQMMSMGCSMGPMMFPGVQQYMQPMGMGMGMGMGMDMTTAAGLNRPMFPFPPVLPTTHLPGHAASHMVPRFPMPPFHMQHIPPSTQSRAQSTSHPNAACNLVGIQRPIQLQLPTMDDPYKHYRGLQYMQVPLHQNQAMTPQSSISNGAETPQNYKSR